MSTRHYCREVNSRMYKASRSVESKERINEWIHLCLPVLTSFLCSWTVQNPRLGNGMNNWPGLLTSVNSQDNPLLANQPDPKTLFPGNSKVVSNWQLKLTRTEERRNKKQTSPKGSVNWTLPVSVHCLPFSALTPVPGGGSTGHFRRPDSERHYKQKTRVWEDCAAPPRRSCSLSTAAHTSWQSHVSASLASPLWVHSHCSVDLNGLTAFVGFSNLFVTLKIAQLLMLPAWTRKSM